MNEKLQVTQNPPLSLDCIRKPVAAGSTMLICFDADTGYGGLYMIDVGMWHTIGPFQDFEAFRRYLGAAFPEAAQALH